VFSFTLSFLALWTMRRTVGIRVDEQVEIVGLDLSEHGAYGYAEHFAVDRVLLDTEGVGMVVDAARVDGELDPHASARG
jgi:hypothetical protein